MFESLLVFVSSLGLLFWPVCFPFIFHVSMVNGYFLLKKKCKFWLKYVKLKFQTTEEKLEADYRNHCFRNFSKASDRPEELVRSARCFLHLAHYVPGGFIFGSASLLPWKTRPWNHPLIRFQKETKRRISRRDLFKMLNGEWFGCYSFLSKQYVFYLLMFFHMFQPIPITSMYGIFTHIYHKNQGLM